MMVYDVTNSKSLETIPIWFEMCRQVDWRSKTGSPVASVLLGNKADLQHRRKLQEPQGLAMAERYLMKHFISSAVSFMLNSWLMIQFAWKKLAVSVCFGFTVRRT